MKKLLLFTLLSFTILIGCTKDEVAPTASNPTTTPTTPITVITPTKDTTVLKMRVSIHFPIRQETQKSNYIYNYPINHNYRIYVNGVLANLNIYASNLTNGDDTGIKTAYYNFHYGDSVKVEFDKMRYYTGSNVVNVGSVSSVIAEVYLENQYLKKMYGGNVTTIVEKDDQKISSGNQEFSGYYNWLGKGKAITYHITK